MANDQLTADPLLDLLRAAEDYLEHRPSCERMVRWPKTCDCGLAEVMVKVHAVLDRTTGDLAHESSEGQSSVALEDRRFGQPHYGHDDE